MSRSSSSKRAALGQSVRILLGMLAVLWLVELANDLEGRSWSAWGILPRTFVGLRGIPCAPFLHAGAEHLALNSLPLIVLGYLELLRGRRAFLRVTLFLVLMSGALVWLFGRSAYHLGASGLVLGYFGHLVAAALHERSVSAVLVACITLLTYGGLLLSVLPGEASVSWESHLAGLVAGVAAAWLGVGRPTRA